MRSYYKSRRWYQRYLEMYENLIKQGVSTGSALIALRECHEMMNRCHRYGRYFISESADDSIKHIEFDVHNPKNVLVKGKKKIEIGVKKVMICKATNLEVEMMYTGNSSEDGKTNGHRGWLCLHDEYGR